MQTSGSILLFLLMLAAVSAGSCKKDRREAVCDGSAPTYVSGISLIINGTCMGSSCHSGGSKNGAWTSYASLKPVLDNGEFEKRVLTRQNMPKGSSLSQEQLNKIRCWADSGYPEQ